MNNKWIINRLICGCAFFFFSKLLLFYGTLHSLAKTRLISRLRVTLHGAPDINCTRCTWLHYDGKISGLRVSLRAATMWHSASVSHINAIGESRMKRVRKIARWCCRLISHLLTPSHLWTLPIFKFTLSKSI